MEACPFFCFWGNRVKNIGAFFVIIISLVTAVSFQNCSPTNFASSQKEFSGGITKLPNTNQQAHINEQIIDQASSYTKVIFEDQKEVFDRSGIHKVRLQIDLLSGLMDLEKTVGTYKTTSIESDQSCAVDVNRLKELDSLLKNSRVCQAINELQEEGTATCLAIATSDIQLINTTNSQSIELSQNICNHGVFLCEGLDQKFREMLKDIIANPPEACK